MIRPPLSQSAHAFVGILVRPLFFGPDGQLLDDEEPEHWPLIDATEPRMTQIAELRLSLLSTSLDESLTRAIFEIECYPTDSPIGPTQPRVGDLLSIELASASGVHQSYRVELTHDWVLSGVDADIGPGELLLKLHGLWLDDMEA